MNNKRSEVFIYTRMCNTGIVLTSKGRMNLKGLLSTSIVAAILAAEQLLEEMKHRNESDLHLNEHM